jgi:hypothetical protein
MPIRVEHSSIVGERARQLSRVSSGLEPLPVAASVSRPQRFDKDGRPIRFNNSEGYSDEVGGAWVANEIDAPLDGYARHVAEFIDAGLCSTRDVL